MRLRQIFLAVAIIPALQLSASAQKIFREMDDSGQLLFQTRPFEIVKANPPEAPKAKPAGEETAKPSDAVAMAAAAAAAAPAPVPTPLQFAVQGKVFSDTYLDAYRILREEN